MKYTFLFICVLYSTLSIAHKQEDNKKKPSCDYYENYVSCTISIFEISTNTAARDLSLISHTNINLGENVKIHALQNNKEEMAKKTPVSILGFLDISILDKVSQLNKVISFRNIDIKSSKINHSHFYSQNFISENNLEHPHIHRLAELELTLREVDWTIKNKFSNKILNIRENMVETSEPGSYDKVSLNHGSEWKISPGIYHLKEFDFKEDSKLVIKKSKATQARTVIYIYGDIGSLPEVQNLSSLEFAVIYLSKHPVKLTKYFGGAWFSPFADLSIGRLNDNLVQLGSFRANKITVDENTQIHHYPFDLYSLIPNTHETSDIAQDLNPQIELSDIQYSTPQLQQLVDAHINNLFAVGEDALTNYELSLQVLREHAQIVIPELINIYDNTQLVTGGQMRRWSMVHMMSEMNDPLTSDKLYDIATSEIDYTYAPYISNDYHGPSYEAKEYSIRASALDGIATLAAQGHKSSDDKLKNYLLSPAKKDLMLMKYAIHGYLKAGDTHLRREELKLHLGQEYASFLNED